MKKSILILALICMIILPAFTQTGSYTTHNLFYLPEYGASGLTEYNEYNAYQEIADNQIWDNKLAIENLQPLVSFTFDDGYESQYTIMKPMFDTQGEVGVIYMQTNRIPSGLTEAQLQTFQNDGWEIASHSVTHPHLIGLSEAEIEIELTKSKRKLESLGLVVHNFCYPYHDQNALIRKITRKYYRSARGNSESLVPYPLPTYSLPCYNIDDHTLLNTYKGYIDDAESAKKWIIFFMHDCTTDDRDTVSELIDYIQAKGIKIVTINQGLDLLNHCIEVLDTDTGGLTRKVDDLIFRGDVPTDRWLFKEDNTFFGIDVVGSCNLTHDTGSEGYKNTAFGYKTLEDITTGYENVAIGHNAQANLTSGLRNVSVGSESMKGIVTGYGNTALGYTSLFSLTSGSMNVGLGQLVLHDLQSGNSNTGIGENAGKECLGSFNVFLGYNAGYSETGSYKLYIDSSNTATPLIYGEFDNDLLKFNADVYVEKVLMQKVVTIVDGDATPDVSAGNIFITSANTGATEITDLDNPTVGQIVTLIGGSDTDASTISDAGNFKLSATMTLGLDDSITLFVKVDNYYVELSRSTN